MRKLLYIFIIILVLGLVGCTVPQKEIPKYEDFILKSDSFDFNGYYGFNTGDCKTNAPVSNPNSCYITSFHVGKERGEGITEVRCRCEYKV